jgi:hypothetical protein
MQASWNVIAHAQKPDFVFRRNGRVHLNRRGRPSGRLLTAEMCALAVVMMDTPCSEAEWRVRYWLPTPFASFPFTSPPVRHRVPSLFNWSLQLNLSSYLKACNCKCATHSQSWLRYRIYTPNVSDLLHTKCHLMNANIPLLIDSKQRRASSVHFTYLQHFQHTYHEFILHDPWHRLQFHTFGLRITSY